MEPLPHELHPDVAAGLRGAGIDSPVEPPGRGAVLGDGAHHDRHHRHRLGQVAVLQPAGAAHAVARRARPGALPLPVQGARAGPGAGAARARRQARAAGDLRRRHAARAAPGDPAAGEPRAHQPGHAARRDPPEPPRVGATSSPTSPSSWSTRRTSTAASSARTWRTSCAGCGGSPRPTAPRRASCWPAHDRQPGRAGRAADRADRRGHDRARRLARDQAQHRHVEPAGHRRGDRRAALRAGRGGRPAGRAGHRGRADDRVHEVAQVGRADLPLHPAAAARRRQRAARRADRALPRRLHARSSGASSSSGSWTASCSASSPRTRWSWASTSARWTRRSASRSPARSPRCARCGAGPAAAGRGLAVYVAGEDALDQFFCRHPDEFLERAVEAAILDPFNEELFAAHLLCAAHEARAVARGRRDPRPVARDGGHPRRRRASCAGARTAATSRAGRRSSRPAACRCAAPRATPWRSSTRPPAS